MKKRNQDFEAPTLGGKGNRQTQTDRVKNPEAAAKKRFEQGHRPPGIPVASKGSLSPAERRQLSNNTNVTAKIGHEKHYAALGEDKRGKEGLALVDAPNLSAAKVKLQGMGVILFHEPVEESLKFDHGNSITQVHDDGRLAARVQGKEVAITKEGEVIQPVPPGQQAFIKQSLGNSVAALKANLIQKFEKGKLPGAPLNSHGVPMMPARRVAVHRTKHGALTRRSDR